jgi:hypothetical protein
MTAGARRDQAPTATAINRDVARGRPATERVPQDARRRPFATTKPPLCQECAKTGEGSPTIRGQSGQNQPLNWAFQNAMAPCETRWTVGFGFTHQRSAVRYRPRPPITPAERRTPMRCRRDPGSSGPTRKGRPRFRRARSRGSPAARPRSATRRDSRTRIRRGPARSETR